VRIRCLIPSTPYSLMKCKAKLVRAVVACLQPYRACDEDGKRQIVGCEVSGWLPRQQEHWQYRLVCNARWGRYQKKTVTLTQRTDGEDWAFGMHHRWRRLSTYVSRTVAYVCSGFKAVCQFVDHYSGSKRETMSSWQSHLFSLDSFGEFREMGMCSRAM
jgi:hypothetical protein